MLIGLTCFLVGISVVAGLAVLIRREFGEDSEPIVFIFGLLTVFILALFCFFDHTSKPDWKLTCVEKSGRITVVMSPAGYSYDTCLFTAEAK